MTVGHGDLYVLTLGAMTMTMHGDRAEVTPFGLAGGTNGGPNTLRLRRASSPDTEEELGMHAVGIRLASLALAWSLLYLSIALSYLSSSSASSAASSSGLSSGS